VTERMVLQQTQEVASFAEVLQALHQQRYTGTLVLHLRYGHPKVVELHPVRLTLTATGPERT